MGPFMVRNWGCRCSGAPAADAAAELLLLVEDMVGGHVVASNLQVAGSSCGAVPALADIGAGCASGRPALR